MGGAMALPRRARFGIHLKTTGAPYLPAIGEAHPSTTGEALLLRLEVGTSL